MNLLPLELWRQEMGYQPWHFWGLADSTIVPVTSKCNDVIREYSWQATDEAGRDEIRQSIETAERLLLDNMGFRPAPAYASDTVLWPSYLDQRLERTGRADARGRWVPVRLNEGYIQNLGIEAHTVIELGAAVVYSDEDTDGLEETFTVTVPTTLTDPTQIAVYFASADRLDEDDTLSARWRIEPVNIQITGGNAIIKGKKWLCVFPVKYEVKTNYPLDPTVAANFIRTCDVYRRYTYRDGDDSTTDSQAAMIWETRPCTWGCDCSTANSSDPSSEGWVAARGGIRDALNGIVTPAEAVYNAATATWSHPCECLDCCGSPDRVLVRYLAGMSLDSKGWMMKPMRTLVSRLAAAEMNKRICACDAANREWSNWQFDISRVNAPEQYQTSLEQLNNPLGTRRGHVYAWQQIKQLARAVGFLA